MQNKFFNSKLNTTLLSILIILIIIALIWMSKNKQVYFPQINQEQSIEKKVNEESVKGTYTYTNHGFSIELPNGYIPTETEGEGGPGLFISLPKGGVVYTLVSNWEKYNLPSYTYVKDEQIGATKFKVYTYSGLTFYWLKQGNVGYEFSGDIDKKQLATFKFVGSPQTTSDEQHLTGKITALDNGCWSDGICKIQIDNKAWVTYNIGRNLNHLPIGNVEGELKIGVKVEVYGEKDGTGGDYTIVGNENYYIKVI